MGATSWRCFTPYCTDPEVALQSLRLEVFAQGEYTNLNVSLEQHMRRTALRFGEDPDSPEVRRQIEDGLSLQRAIETGETRGLPPAERAVARRVLGAMRALEQFGVVPSTPPAGRPRSISELLELMGECGTHTVLDIERVGARPGFAVAAPMTSNMVRRVFGTDQPTHTQVEDNWADVAEKLGRWQARYLAVYLDGEPHEYCFIGCTGD